MNGKNNYNKTKIIDKINQFVKRNNNGENIVFYFIDTDNINSDRQHFDSFLNISNFFCQLYFKHNFISEYSLNI